jgi:acyl-CoA thioester hydrolase
VRFEEIDAMGIAWHGNYASYFDDARKKLGDKYGFSYKDFIRERIKVPVKHFFVDYIIPLTFDETIRIKAKLHWCEAAKLNMTYEIFNERNQLSSTGYTVQLFMNENNELLFTLPECVQIFRKKWKEGCFDI